MALHESGEDYLEAILMLRKEKGYVRSIDVAQHLGYSKPSVSRAMSILKASGHIVMEKDGRLELTPSGEQVAQEIYERHRWLHERASGQITHRATAVRTVFALFRFPTCTAGLKLI